LKEKQLKYCSGFTRITLEWPSSGNGSSQESLSVTIERQKGVLDAVFTGSVIVFIAVLFINFGTAIDLTVLREIITRPVGPAIGFVGQFIFMPLVSLSR
jgi:solute carrier family 10 (sodium/bile acid cotransporter), member 3/5